MKNFDEVTQVTQKLLQTGFIFESSESGLIPLHIHRKISKDQSVDILPILKKILETKVPTYLGVIGSKTKASRLRQDLRQSGIVEEKINQSYESQSGKSRDKMFNYFIANKLKHLMENIQEF